VRKNTPTRSWAADGGNVLFAIGRLGAVLLTAVARHGLPILRTDRDKHRHADHCPNNGDANGEHRTFHGPFPRERWLQG